MNYLNDKELLKMLNLDNTFINPFDFGRQDFFVQDALTRFIKPKLSLEIGTCEGFSTKVIAKNSDNVITIDLHKNKVAHQNTTMHKMQIGELKSPDRIGWAAFDCSNVHQLFTDSKYLDDILDLEFNYIFLDGSHHIDYIRNDYTYAVNHISSPGAVVMHDYTNVPDITNFVNSLSDPDIYHAGQWCAFKIF